jgi:secondary thiamine-phosphate synthase enzyme
MLTLPSGYMSETHTIEIRTTTREEMVDVTALVRSTLKRAGVDRGIAVVYCPHTTAGVTVQENSDPTVKSDMLGHLRKLVPKDGGFAHAEDNSDAHIKCSLVGVSTTLIVEGGRPQLGHWQAVFFCEFDGPRDRRLLVRVIPG